MPESHYSIHAELRDLGYVHDVSARIRHAAADVVDNPLDEDAGNSLGLLLLVEAASARAVLAKVETLEHLEQSAAPTRRTQGSNEAGMR